MKYIKRMADITIVGPDKQPTDTIYTFVKWFLARVNDPKCSKRAKDVLMNRDIEIKVEEYVEEQLPYLALTDPEWNHVKPSVDEPTNGYINPIASQLTSYLKAFLEAADDRPDEKTAPEPEGTDPEDADDGNVEPIKSTG